MTQQEVEKQPIATSNDVHRRNCTGVGGGGVDGGGVIGGVVGGGVVSGGGVTVGGGSVGVGVGVGVGVTVTVGVGVGVGVGPGGTCSSTHNGNTYYTKPLDNAKISESLKPSDRSFSLAVTGA